MLLIAKLFDSVAPEVSIISSGSQLIREAIFFFAFSSTHHSRIMPPGHEFYFADKKEYE